MTDPAPAPSAADFILLTGGLFGIAYMTVKGFIWTIDKVAEVDRKYVRESTDYWVKLHQNIERDRSNKMVLSKMNDQEVEDLLVSVTNEWSKRRAKRNPLVFGL